MSSILALWTGVMLAAGGPVTGVSVVSASQATDVLIHVEGKVQYRDFTMEGPARLVVDLMGARHALPRDNFYGIDRGGVVSLRTSQYSGDVVRVVVELEKVVPYTIAEEDGSLRIELKNADGPFQAWSSQADAQAATSVPAPAAPTPAAPAPAVGRTQGDQAAAAPRVALRGAQVQEKPPISVSFENTPIQDVLFTFADFAGRSIVAGQNVSDLLISAVIDNQPWDVALDAILGSYGLVARELDSGIIRVDNVTSLNDREQIEPLVTRAYRVNYATAAELQGAAQTLLTTRGKVSIGQGTNTVIVTDIPRVQQAVQNLIKDVDIRTPQVAIQAKIVFVNRTDLADLGVTYELKDSQGNQLNVVSPGATDKNGDGTITLPDEQVDQGTNVYSLGGSSIAALGNANNRVAAPTLTLLTSLLVGRHTLVNFLEALESVNLSDIQAVPTVTVLDNRTARIQVGEQTPLRVLDAQATGGGGALPVSTVQIQQTGIILTATPHVTATGDILLELNAERSAPIPAQSDVGFIFQTQNANTQVLVKDGETVVIGGLTVTEKSEVRSGIPLLMDLPLLGKLFRVTQHSTIQRDLIILVTPNIVRSQD